MSNTFNINRFGKVLMLDSRKYYRNFGITLVILSALTLILWLLTLIFNFSMPAFFRWITITLGMWLAIILVPAKAFGDINLPRKGVRFAMLPASNLEKFLSYLFFCILTPILVILLSWGLDSLLTALPFGGYEHYIKELGFFNNWERLITEIDPASMDMDSEEYSQFQQISSRFSSRVTYNTILSILFNIGIFMLGNLLFKSHKTAKTLACTIGISYLLTLMIQVIFVSKGVFPWIISTNGNSASVSLDPEIITKIGRYALLVSSVIRTVLTAGLLIGIFFKIKTQKY